MIGSRDAATFQPEARAFRVLRARGRSRTYDQRVSLLSLGGLRDVLPAFLISRLLILLVLPVAERLVRTLVLIQPLPEHFPAGFDAQWFQWDSVWYLHIATMGYGTTQPPDPSFAFFPLYPLLINLLLRVWPWTPLAAGLLVANVCSLAAFALLYRLVSLDLGRARAVRTLWVLAFMPTSLYLSAAYSEGLFLLCVVLCLYLARRGHWIWAGVAGALGLATHATGIIVFGPLAVLYYQQFASVSRRSALAGWRQRVSGIRDHARAVRERLLGAARNPVARRAVIGMALIPCGVLAYMLYLWHGYGDPLLFRASEAANWHRGLALPWRTASDQVQFFLNFPPSLTLASTLYDRDTITLIVTFPLCVIATRALPRYQAALIWTFWLLILSTPLGYQGFYDPLQSLSRYVLVLFPLWVYLAATPRRAWITCLISLPVLIANTALFVSGAWVA